MLKQVVSTKLQKNDRKTDLKRKNDKEKTGELYLQNYIILKFTRKQTQRSSNKQVSCHLQYR